MWHYRYLLLLLPLCACQPEHSEKNKVENSSNTTAKNIASSILNTPQTDDILQANKQALSQISASDIAAAEQLNTHFDNATPIDIQVQAASTSNISDTPIDLSKLPESCRQYYQRAERCFATQTNADALIQLLREQQQDLLQDNPDETACQILNRSFDAVAQNLQCP